MLKTAFCRSCHSIQRQLWTQVSLESKLPMFRKSMQKFNFSSRFNSSGKPRHPALEEKARRTRAIAAYTIALGAGMFGLAYMGVPLYRIYCQKTGKGTKAELAKSSGDRIMAQQKAEDRVITVRFAADTSTDMTWDFKPLQREIKVVPGETALAFYKAKNPENRPIIGIATYNIVPYEAGAYFTKVQCFCFDEQRLNPGEELEMPVLFYIDSDFANDPLMEKLDTITLSYTFFESRDYQDDDELTKSPVQPQSV